MQPTTQASPATNFALVIDGQIKTEFKTKEGAFSGAREMKRRFPMLQVRVYDPETKTSEDVGLSPIGA